MNLTDLVRAYFKVKDDEPRMRREYPAGTCNAEDAWREYADKRDEAEAALRNAVKS